MRFFKKRFINWQIGVTFKQNEKNGCTEKNAINFNMVPTLDFHVFKTILLRRFPKTDKIVHGTKQVKIPKLE